MTGTPSQIEWAEQIKLGIDAELTVWPVPSWRQPARRWIWIESCGFRSKWSTDSV